MSLSFYQQQKTAQRNIRFLFLLFIINALSLVFAITIITAAALNAMADELFLDGRVSVAWLFVLALLMSFTIFGLSFSKLKKLSHGAYTATMLGGERLQAAQTLPEQQLRNTIEEMAIAAHIPVPHIYILPLEPSVNAFAAGLNPADMSVGFTRGCLEKLNRDELQAIAAYEMAQIINGNARLNTLIYGTLFGIEFFCTHIMSWVCAICFGLAYIWVIYVVYLAIALFCGYLSAQIIKAFVCRQNVYQSDATAVQLSRNAHGLASVLQKNINSAFSYILFADAFVSQLEHFLFSFGKNPVFQSSVLRTHPDCESRIQKILPNWDGKLPDMPISENKPILNNKLPAELVFLGVSGSLNNNTTGVSGSLNNHTPKGEQVWLSFSRNPDTAPAVIAALLARYSENLPECLAISELFNVQWKTIITQLLNEPLPLHRRFAILAVALPNVCLAFENEDKAKQYGQFLQQIIQADNKTTLFEHCVFAAISGCLNIDGATYKQSHYSKITHTQDYVAQLFMLTARHANQGKNAENNFQAACAAYQIKDLPLKNIDLNRLPEIIHNLKTLPLAEKQRIIHALNIIAIDDKEISLIEQEWIATISLALGVR
ncbi:MAG: M48 family metalloprotease [Neisseriaceae bacterium]|nr:M48 family metalloprotease [Neisseriaceae bacterium]